MVSLGHADPGPKCENLPREIVKPAFAELCRSLGIEPGQTWVLEVSGEGILQFTRPMTEAELAKFLSPKKARSSRRNPSRKAKKPRRERASV